MPNGNCTLQHVCCISENSIAVPRIFYVLEQTTIIFTFEHFLVLVHLCAWEQYLYEDRPGKRQKCLYGIEGCPKGLNMI